MKPKGWRFESKRHSLASRGISSTQRIKILSRLNQHPVMNKNVALVRVIREKLLKKMFIQASEGNFSNPQIFKPFLGEFSIKDDDYVVGDIFYDFGNRTMPESATLKSYLSFVKGDTEKDKLKKIIYSKDPAVVKEVTELDLDIIQFLSRNQDFKYKVVSTDSGNKKLITYSKEFRKQKPEFFNELIKKVKQGR